MLAAEGGTTIAIILAVITLIGTVSANVVAWHKIRADAKNQTQQLKNEHEQSNVEIAQAVMAQTVTTLNERLQTEFELNEKNINALKQSHDNQMEKMRIDHARDISRLEGQIERLRDRNSELKAEIERMKGERSLNGK